MSRNNELNQSALIAELKKKQQQKALEQQQEAIPAMQKTDQIEQEQNTPGTSQVKKRAVPPPLPQTQSQQATSQATVLAPALQIPQVQAQVSTQVAAPFMRFSEHFKGQSGDDVGGKTGSARMKSGIDGKFYQVKGSILDAESNKTNNARKVRDSGTDVENFNQFFAAAVLGDDSTPKLTDKVRLIYFEGTDKRGPRVGITSEYLPNVVYGSLDGLAHKAGTEERESGHVRLAEVGAKDQESGHVRITFNGQNLEEGEFYLPAPEPTDHSREAEQIRILRKDIAKNITNSVKVQDVDCNPGNQPVPEQNGILRVAQIDAGHANNHLITGMGRLSSLFGGGIQNKHNSVLDYLNRETIMHGSKPNQIPKMWRDFEGVIPSQELVDSFREEAGSIQKTRDRMAGAREEFATFINFLKDDLEQDKASLKLLQGKQDKKSEDKKRIDQLKEDITQKEDLGKHIKKTLIKVNENIGGPKINSDDSLEKVLNQTCNNLTDFYETDQKQMAGVADLIELQLKVDELSKGLIKKEELDREKEKLQEEKKKTIAERRTTNEIDDKIGALNQQIATLNDPNGPLSTLEKDIQSRYDKLKDNPELGAYDTKGKKIEGKIQWVKTERDTPAFQGDLREYLAERTNKIKLLNLKRNVDKLIRDGNPINIEFYHKIEEQYESLAGKKDLKGDKVVNWGEIGPGGPTFDGTLDKYIAARTNRVELKRLQRQIDDFLVEELAKNGTSIKTALKKIPQAIIDQYDALKVREGVNLGGNKIKWQENEIGKGEFKGTLEEYIKDRSKNKKIKAVVERVNSKALNNLQRQIDGFIVDELSKDPPTPTTKLHENIPQEIKDQYAKLVQREGINLSGNKGAKWEPNEGDKKAFEGTLENYIQDRSKKPQIDVMINDKLARAGGTFLGPDGQSQLQGAEQNRVLTVDITASMREDYELFRSDSGGSVASSLNTPISHPSIATTAPLSPSSTSDRKLSVIDESIAPPNPRTSAVSESYISRTSSSSVASDASNLRSSVDVSSPVLQSHQEHVSREEVLNTVHVRNRSGAFLHTDPTFPQQTGQAQAASHGVPPPHHLIDDPHAADLIIMAQHTGDSARSRMNSTPIPSKELPKAKQRSSSTHTPGHTPEH